MKRIILCADDYGQNSAISQAIIALAEKGRLSATSCLVTTPGWHLHAKKLKPLQNIIDVGLHFNLTEGHTLSTNLAAAPLSKLMLKAYLRALSKKSLTQELNKQIDRYTEELNQLPHYIDGHQHILQFPQIRDALLDVYEKRLRLHGVYVRSTYQPAFLTRFTSIAYCKQLIVHLCGGIRFKKLLEQHQIPHNQTFSGIYNFAHAEQYPKLFLGFLNQIKESGIIMCHPGLKNSLTNDPIHAARPYEYEYLSSTNFLNDLATHQIKLVRFSDFIKK